MAEQLNTLQERVTAICNDLLVKGTKPSVRIVLSMLPDISSTSTVHKYFAIWKKEQVANQQSLYDRLGFSSEFTQSFLKEITRFSVEAEQRYKELAVDANDQCDIALEDLERSEERLHKQNAILEQDAKEIKELQTELLRVEQKFKAELAQEKETNSVVVQELRQQLSKNAQDNEILTTSNEQIRTDIAKAELKLEGNLEYVTEVKEQNKELTNDNKQLNINIAELSKTIAGNEAVISGNDKLIVNYEKAQTTAQDRLDKTENERISLLSEVGSLRKTLESTNGTLANTKEQLNTETSQVVELRASMEDQVRATDKTAAIYEGTIAGNGKLISQLELSQNNLENANSKLSDEIEELSGTNEKLTNEIAKLSN